VGQGGRPAGRPVARRNAKLRALRSPSPAGTGPRQINDGTALVRADLDDYVKSQTSHRSRPAGPSARDCQTQPEPAGRRRRYRGIMRYSSIRNHDPSPTAISLRQVITPGSVAPQPAQVPSVRPALGPSAHQAGDPGDRAQVTLKPPGLTLLPSK
jgi:hypothetical protein